jgi:hypothetical protein
MAKHTFRRKVAKPIQRGVRKELRWTKKTAKKGLRGGVKGISHAWKSVVHPRKKK